MSVAETGAPLDPGAPLVVGTEAALHRVAAEPGPPVGLVAYLDADQELLAPRFRAAEQALWLLVRGARLVGDRHAGGRLLAQTRVPDHEVLTVARRGDPVPLVRAEAARRAELGFPPFGGLAALTGDVDAVRVAADALRSHLEVLGPVDGRALLRAAVERRARRRARRRRPERGARGRSPARRGRPATRVTARPTGSLDR